MGRAAKALVGLAAAVLMLSGCAGHSPRNAATVNDTVITVSDLEATSVLLKPYLQDPSEPAVLSMLVQMRVATEIASQRKLAFTDAERAAVVQGLPPDLVSDTSAMATGFVTDYTTYSLTFRQLTQDGYLEAAAMHKVEVNPKYGTWQPDRFALTGSGSLSVPAATSPR